MTAHEQNFMTNKELYRALYDNQISMNKSLDRIMLDVAVIKEKDSSLKTWQNTYAGKISAIEDTVKGYGDELITISATKKVVGYVSTTLIALASSVTASVITVLISKFFVK